MKSLLVNGKGELAPPLQMLVAALENVDEGVLIVDREGRVIYANPAVEALLHVPAGRVTGGRLSLSGSQAGVREILKTGNESVPETVRVENVEADIPARVTAVRAGGRWLGAVVLIRPWLEGAGAARDARPAGADGADAAGVSAVTSGSQGDRLPVLLPELPASFESLVGRNARFLEALAVAARVAPTDTTVLIRGESGVGKELLAKAIHNASARREKPLVRVNCAAIPETLLESELFGYDGGAFTGARRDGKLGKFELAHGGTLFLDEVGDMSLAMQAKLLRVIQEREIERVGGSRSIKVDVRIIAATNQDLEAMVGRKSFREDLYYRLNVVSIVLPPLRERKDDLPSLLDRLLEHHGKVHGKKVNLSRGVLDVLYRHDWPGNVRELHNVLEHMVILCRGDVVSPDMLPRYLRERYGYLEEEPPALPVACGDEKLGDMVAEVERKAILAALETCDHNKSRAMKLLGVSRRTFYRKLKKYGLA